MASIKNVVIRHSIFFTLFCFKKKSLVKHYLVTQFLLVFLEVQVAPEIEKFLLKRTFKHSLKEK